MMIAAFVLATYLTHNAATSTAAALRERIRSAGASAALSELSSDESSWERFLRRIAVGDREMLAIGVRLYKVADAHVAEDMVHAFGEALKADPERVLSTAGKDVGVQMICSAPDVDDARFDSSAAALRELHRRERAVRTSSGGRARVECLRSLAAAEKDVRRFFSK